MENLEWYIIRATGTVAYLLLYLSVIIGFYSQVLKKQKQRVTTTLDLHEALADWALFMVCGHLVFLLVDRYIGFYWEEVFVPFAITYNPFSMAMGILSLYFLIIIIITSKARNKMGYQKWRKLHALNPILYVMVTLHGLFLGTDFQGITLAVINIVPLFIMGLLLLKLKLSN